MPLSPFIWNDGQAMTPEQVARQRDLVEAARERAGDTSPVGHWTAGMARIVDALGGNLRERRADAAEEAGLASAKEKVAPIISAASQGGGRMTATPDIISALMTAQSDPWVEQQYPSIIKAMMNDVPRYRLGTNYHPGGPAIVGEDGPELAWLPRGSVVEPNPETDIPPDRMREIEAMTPTERQMLFQQLNGGSSPDDAFPPEGFNPIEARFMDEQAYQVADAGSVTSDAFPISPAGVGDQSDINRAAYSYRTFNNALDDYKKIVAEGGVSIIPGVQKDSIDVARRNLQMQMKELYNLGVLNGPDLDLMNQIIVDPTGLGNKALDFLGIADTEDRVAHNVDQVRGIMRQLVEPKLKAIGVSPEQIYSPQDMPEGEFLKFLGLE